MQEFYDIIINRKTKKWPHKLNMPPLFPSYYQKKAHKLSDKYVQYKEIGIGEYGYNDSSAKNNNLEECMIHWSSIIILSS
jgi:hypothetical protein